MASETPETDSFLAMIANRIALLQALAESYRAARDAGALGQPGEGDGLPFASASASASTLPRMPSNAPVELPTGAFRGKGIRSAIKMYLGAAKRKQPFKEIATALKVGGLESTSSDFERTLNATLHQLKNSGVLIQFPEGWDLADAYPESFRQRLTNNKESKPATREKRKRKRGRAKARAKGKAKQAPAPKLVTRPKKKAETGATEAVSAA